MTFCLPFPGRTECSLVNSRTWPLFLWLMAGPRSSGSTILAVQRPLRKRCLVTIHCCMGGLTENKKVQEGGSRVSHYSVTKASSGMLESTTGFSLASCSMST